MFLGYFIKCVVVVVLAVLFAVVREHSAAIVDHETLKKHQTKPPTPKLLQHEFFKGKHLKTAIMDITMPMDLKLATFMMRLAYGMQVRQLQSNYTVSDDTKWFYQMFSINTDELFILPEEDHEEIKSGSFGVIRRGVYKGLPVVIKEMKEGEKHKPGDSESTEREFYMNAILRNIPGFPMIYGFRRDLKPQLLVIEMIADADGSLSDNIVVRLTKEKNHLSPWDVVDICRKVILILLKIHKHGCVHADIKRGNILLQKREDGSLYPYIIDFNLSLFAHEFPPEEYTMKEAITKMQSFYQYAPELYMEDISESPSSDTYSMGKIFEFIADGMHNKIIGDAASMMVAEYKVRATLKEVDEFLKNAHLFDKYTTMYPLEHDSF